MMRFVLEMVSPVAVFVAGFSTSVAVETTSVEHALYAIALLIVSIVAATIELHLDR